MKSPLLLILALLSTNIAFATAQVAERIEYNGENLMMFSTPLEDAFSQDRPRPDDLFIPMSTANWRGYVGHWKADGDQLLLTAIYRDRYEKDESGTPTETRELVPLDKVLGPTAAYPAKADWFTGTLRLPKGERVRYVHMGFGSQYEKEVVLKIEGGKIVQAVEIAYDPEKDAYRSNSDMQWVAMGDGLAPPAHTMDWIDGRFLPSPMMYPFMQDKRSFKTRGIFFTDEEGASLWIPETVKTQPLTLPVNKIPADNTIPKGSHVEIEARFYETEEHYELEATSIRLLRPGETIHHPTYPAKLRQIEEQLERGVEPTISPDDATSPAPLPANDQ